MIDPKATITWAQYNEDIILSALLHDVEKGFYIDVGANSPTIDSVTKMFYERGWRGINIEPIKKFFDRLQKDRPEDINLQLGVGDQNGTVTFREYPKNPGYSTFTNTQKKMHGKKYPYNDYEVTVIPLQNILLDNKVKHIHFLKVDAEGYEYEVIVGNDWQKFRPEVICIESSHMTKDWRPILIDNGYRSFITDGLNDYYIAKEAWSRTEGFDERTTKRHAHALKFHQYRSWSSDSKKLNKLSKMASDQQRLIDGLGKKIDHLTGLAALSLEGQPLPVRLKRAIYGLSIDWWRFKKQPRK